MLTPPFQKLCFNYQQDQKSYYIKATALNLIIHSYEPLHTYPHIHTYITHIQNMIYSDDLSLQIIMYTNMHTQPIQLQRHNIDN